MNVMVVYSKNQSHVLAQFLGHVVLLTIVFHYLVQGYGLYLDRYVQVCGKHEEL